VVLEEAECAVTVLMRWAVVIDMTCISNFVWGMWACIGAQTRWECGQGPFVLAGITMHDDAVALRLLTLTMYD
jgi:hypothetical protein